MKNIILYVVLCALFALASCTRETAEVQVIEKNLPVQDNIILTAEKPESNFVVEINDLNGTWVTEWSYNALLGMAEEERERHIRGLEFSWGEGKRLIHLRSILDTTTGFFLTTVSIDITDEMPFVSAGMSGSFDITNITQTGIDTITVSTIRRQTGFPGGGWPVEFFFQYIDKDTVRIESDEVFAFREGGGVLWRRLSGADERQDNAVLTAERPENNFTVEIADLNGTWLPEFSYHTTEEGRDGWRIFMQEFSWGEGKWGIDLSLNIDITAERPFVHPTGDKFLVTNMTQLGINSIKVIAILNREEDRVIELIFHFIDRDTFWIETHDFRGLDYERGAFWHRLSGPER